MPRGRSVSQLTNSKRIRVTAVAENRMVAFLLKDVLGRFSGCEVVDSAISCEEALSSASANSPDVVVINQNLEGEPLKGLHLAKLLLACSPETKIVIVVDSPACEVIAEAFQSGARGIFHQGEAIEGLWECISHVHQGKIYAGQADVSAIVETLVQSPPVRLLNTHGKAMLTNQEQAVARWVIEGYSNREIAEKLKLSEHTVKNYLFRIFDRLGVSNRAELTLYVLSRRPQPSEPETTPQPAKSPNNDQSPLSSFFKEAQAGCPSAQFRLAEMYHRGQGLPKDSVASYMWLTLAEKTAASVSETARAVRGRMAAKMANSDIAAAESRAVKWLSKHFNGDGDTKRIKRGSEDSAFSVAVLDNESDDEQAIPVPATASA